MADCVIASGFGQGCRSNAGGMYEYFIGNLDKGIAVTPDLLTGGEITDIKDKGTSPAAVEFYKFKPNKNSGEYKEEYQISIENGTRGYAQSVTGNFSKMEQAKQDIVNNLMAGDFLVLIKDRNGKYFLMGENGGCTVSAGPAGTGKALSDLNGYQITLSAEEGNAAREVTAGNIKDGTGTDTIIVASTTT